MRRTELNLFVTFFLGTAAARLRMQLSRSPVSLPQAPACTEVGPPGRNFFFPPLWLVPFLLQAGFPGPLSSGENSGAASQAPGRIIYLFKNRRAAEQRYPGPCGHTLENHTSPDRLCFHCSDLWETCKTQPCGERAGAPREGPFHRHSPGGLGRVLSGIHLPSQSLAEGHLQPGP